jgi:PAS domain S-box-containing protein
MKAQTATPPTSTKAQARKFFPGPGAMRALMREKDWSATELGAIDEWPQSLRSAVDIALGSAFPTLVLWGPRLIQIYNDAYRDVMGEKHPAGLGMPTHECWPEARHISGPLFEQALAGETIFREDVLYPLERHGAPEEVYLTFSFSPLRDDDNRVAGVFVTLHETTVGVHTQEMQAERERLLRELQVERARLEEVFRQAPAFLAVLRGPDYVFQLANDAYVELVGNRDVIGKAVRDALPEVVDQGFIQVLDEVVATGKPFVGREIPVMLQRVDGILEQRFLDFVYQPLTDASGNRVGIVAHGSDITDQTLARREVERVNRQLEQSAADLRASERRLRDLFTQAPVAIAVLTGPEHVYTIASPRYMDTPGGGRPLIGRTVRDAFPELRVEDFAEQMDRVYETGEPYFADERRVMLDRDNDGVLEEYIYNVGYQPLRDAAGKVYAIASVAYDVTEDIRSRRELEMAHSIAENARHEAEEANLAKSAFLTTMSHELRTPLNAIAGYSDLMLLGVRGVLTDGQREDLERIKRSGQYLLSLINDVLNFAKLDAGQVEFRVQEVQVCALLEGLEDLIRPQVVAKGLRYEHGTCPTDLLVLADAEKVRQILLNLLANAVKFTEPGGAVALTCDITDTTVRIAVRDTGRGIEEDQLARVFDPFVQVDRHLTPQSQQGVGLGLAISRDLAIGMGGSLEAESKVNEGSTFTLTLPRPAN